MKNLKPFDLQDALAGKAVMLRQGTKAFVRHHETELNVVNSARLVGFAASGYQLAWCDDGSYSAPSETSCRDIIGMYPETRIINGFEVPAPEEQALERGTTYFAPSMLGYRMCDSFEWDGGSLDSRLLKRGLVFLNKEDAVANAKAMLGIDPYSETE